MFLEVVCFLNKEEFIAEYTDTKTEFKCEWWQSGRRLVNTFLSSERKLLPKKCPLLVSWDLLLGGLNCHRSLITHLHMREAMCRCPDDSATKTSLLPSPSTCQTSSVLSSIRLIHSPVESHPVTSVHIRWSRKGSQGEGRTKRLAPI